MTAQDAILYECPRCHAPPHEPCNGKRARVKGPNGGYVLAFHPERETLAVGRRPPLNPPQTNTEKYAHKQGFYDSMSGQGTRKKPVRYE